MRGLQAICWPERNRLKAVRMGVMEALVELLLKSILKVSETATDRALETLLLVFQILIRSPNALRVHTARVVHPQLSGFRNLAVTIGLLTRSFCGYVGFSSSVSCSSTAVLPVGVQIPCISPVLVQFFVN
ncbi:hypothetical protein Mapa_015483 [Marchantia paleacea]|nr:hypothetical protein Mapa_015483 [Marchantia paleacea]